MKRIIFLVIATLLVIGLVLPGCAGGGGDGNDNGNGGPDTRPSITFAVTGAMTDFTGEHSWAGAELARDEINPGAGVNVGGVYHKIALVQVDTNEVSGTPDESVVALQEVIDDVDFVVGGARTQNVEVYREVAMDAKKIFMGCTAAGSLQYSVVKNYDRYKYWFKVTPPNEWFLLTSLFKMMETFSSMLKDKLISAGDAVPEHYGVPEDGRLRVAVISEDAELYIGLATILAGQAKVRGYDLVGTWLVSPTATNISAELTAIAGKHPHIIIPYFVGPVGAVYSKQKAELEIPAMTIGVNVEGQQKAHWADSEGKCNGEIMLDSRAEGLQNTAKTTAFFDAFVARTGEYPSYTAATYDAIYMLKEAIEAVSAANGWDDIADVIESTNIDALIQYIETNRYTGTAGTVVYFPMPDIDLGGGTYALSEAQVRAIYDLDSYGWTYVQSEWQAASWTITGPCYAHDCAYGPGLATGCGIQWQDGKKVGVWPMDYGDEYDEALTDQYGCWNFEYPGTVDVVIPIEGFLAS